MGVLGLAPFLQKVCPDVFKTLPNRFKELAGKTVVFDGTLITQRFHFAPMPHPYRHVLGWYRMLQELKHAGVSSICVFDGIGRSQAKQMEVDRRREARKIVSARGEFEADRLRRLRKLSVAVKSLRDLDHESKQTATTALRTLVSNSTMPSYTAGDLDLASHLSSRIELPMSSNNEVSKQPKSESKWEDILDLLKRTGVPVTGSGELDPDALAPDHDPPIRKIPSRPDPLVSSFETLSVSEQSAPTVQDTSQREKVSNPVREELADTSRIASSAEQSRPTGDVMSTITNLYMEYRNSATHLDCLPRAIPTQLVESPSDTTDPTETRAEYVMSKSQHLLTAEEGAFWLTLSQFDSSEDVELASDTLTMKSSLLSESYDRRTHPPTYQTYEECKEIIRAMGIPCLETDGPYEAEALASAMVLHGQADYVASEDTDVLVYGAPLVRNVSKGADPLVILSGKEIQEVLELDQEQFIDFALLLGTDFSQRIKNIGPQRALKFIREHGSIEQVIERETKFPPRIPSELYIQQVQLARTVFHTLPSVPEPADLQAPRVDESAVQDILHRYGLGKEVSHDYDWDPTHALSGNYFDDNPTAL